MAQCPVPMDASSIEHLCVFARLLFDCKGPTPAIQPLFSGQRDLPEMHIRPWHLPCFNPSQGCPSPSTQPTSLPWLMGPACQTPTVSQFTLCSPESVGETSGHAGSLSGQQRPLGPQS